MPKIENEQSLAQLASAEDGKKSVRYLKAGATVAAFVSGSMPYLIAAGVAAKVVTPVVREIVSYGRSRTGGIGFNDKRQELCAEYPPASFIRLESLVIPTRHHEDALLALWGFRYRYGIVLYKIFWEHVRKTGSTLYTGTCVVTKQDVLRSIQSTREIQKFVEFLDNKGEKPVEWILDAQS